MAAEIIPPVRQARSWRIDSRWIYFDVIQIWLPRRLTHAELAAVTSRLERGATVHVRDRPMRYAPTWRQRLQIRRPTAAAVGYVNGLAPEALVNAAEVALDLTTPTEADAAALAEFLTTHLVMRWPGRQRMATVEDTTYWAAGRSKRRLALYADRACRMTGEVHCVHLEARLRSAGACRRAGIASLADVAGFDFAAFWRTNLRLYALDLEKLGRAAQRTRRRSAWMRPYGSTTLNWDRRVGAMIARNAQPLGPDGGALRPLGCVEDVRRYCRFDIGRALAALPVGDLWPL